jgi:hypothetical protein
VQFDAEKTKHVLKLSSGICEVMGGYLNPGPFEQYTGHLILSVKGYHAGLTAQGQLRN